ncbi:MAG: DNA polymerase III subunit alpha [Clostridiales Family XIII bacterium]|nr:DNA polymerase III subunit alpha [Clostridiales Family XIII bacterium]
MGFTHLHVHSEFSLLDGLASVKELIKVAEQQGMKSLAITDHGNMFGVVDFYNEALQKDAQGDVLYEDEEKTKPKYRVKPIIGCEVYTAPRTRFDKETGIDNELSHLVLLVKNRVGYENLTKIVSNANTEGFYYKPRTDMDQLREHSEGLIALSACVAGSIPKKLIQGDYDGAKAIATEFLDIYGDGNFYLELQDHGLEEELMIRGDIKKLSRETGIPLVATNDVHYVNRDDSKSHDILLCVQTGQKVTDENRMRFTGDQFHFRTETEMRELFSDIPEAIDNTEVIAQKCNFDFDFQKKHFPEFDTPEGFTAAQYLRKQCEEGLEYRYGAKKEIHRERLEYELSVIEKAGFADYFLIVWDFIRDAIEKGIAVGPGRGSAAGSIVAYVLRITNIDPIKYGLIFERFLNLERVSMPDIDIDFCIDRRSEVIDYVRQKYGENNVAQIITFGTMKAKAAIKDVGRVLDIPYGEVDKIVKLLPEKARTIDEALAGMSKDKKGVIIDEFKLERGAFRKIIGSDNRYAALLGHAKALEGKARQPGMHAAGVVICNEALSDCIPLYLTKEKAICVQYNMTTVETLNFLKMDFLGLRNLTVINEAKELIKKNRGTTFDMDSLQFDDENVYRLISSGDTEGVFQLEGGGMQNFMRQLKPNCFEDIIVGISMYRPGPMDDIEAYLKNRKNPESIEYLHPSLKEILLETYGVMVYQEQVMEIVRELAGYTYGQSDVVRRVMSKKKVDKMKEERQFFVYGRSDGEGNMLVPGCVSNGIPEETANEIFDQMISFASYAFNKSHAAVYAVLAYQTAYMKTYYPEEFLAALMNSVMGTKEKVTKYIKSARDSGIPVLPPDILKGEKRFHVRDGKIVMGLQSVKNVGESVIDSVISAREEQEITDMVSFVSAVDSRKVNKKAVQSLIYAGAFDSLCENRAQSIEEYESLACRLGGSARSVAAGQTSLFDSVTEEPLPDFPEDVRLEKEKEMLGFYFSAHPLDKYKWIADQVSTSNIHMICNPEEYEDISQSSHPRESRVPIIMVGLIETVQHRVTKRGDQMAVFSFEDYFGAIEVLVFKDKYKKYAEILTEGSIVVLRGNAIYEVDRKPCIHAVKITPIEKVEEFYANQSEKRGDN